MAPRLVAPAMSRIEKKAFNAAGLPRSTCIGAKRENVEMQRWSGSW